MPDEKKSLDYLLYAPYIPGCSLIGRLDRRNTVALTAAERRARLRRGDIGVVAKRLGVTPQTVSIVVDGRSKSRRIAKAISRRIRVRFLEAFPEYDRRRRSA